MRLPPRSNFGLIDLLLVLTAFETFDALASPERTIADVVPAVQSLMRSALGRIERDRV